MPRVMAVAIDMAAAVAFALRKSTRAIAAAFPFTVIHPFTRAGNGAESAANA